MTYCAELEDRSILILEGEDVRKFLQSIVTNNIERLFDENAAPPHVGLHAGLLTPQGKILFDFFVIRVSPPDAAMPRLLIETRSAESGELAKRLIFYKLRARVNITPMTPPAKILALWTDSGAAPEAAKDTLSSCTPAPEALFFDPRHPAMGLRAVFSSQPEPELTSACRCEIKSAAHYHAHRIRLGITEGGLDYPFGTVFPHEANMDQLAGVDFAKGCYVGQEVVSRMQHKTTVRKRFIKVQAVSGELPAPGSEILANDFPVGTMGTSAGRDGLALIRLDRAMAAVQNNQNLMAGNTAITFEKPDWARFDLPSV